jgi:hypothetical protein
MKQEMSRKITSSKVVKPMTKKAHEKMESKSMKKKESKRGYKS